VGQGAPKLQSAEPCLVSFRSDLILLAEGCNYANNYCGASDSLSICWGKGGGVRETGYPRHRKERHFLASLSDTVPTDGSLLRDKAAVLRHSTKEAFCIYCTAHEELNSR